MHKERGISGGSKPVRIGDLCMGLISRLQRAMASRYERSASVVRNSAVWSVLSTGELLAPTEGAPCDGIGPVSVVLGLDPKDNFGSLSGRGGGMPLFGWLDLCGGMDVGMVSDGELSSGSSKSFP